MSTILFGKWDKGENYDTLLQKLVREKINAITREKKCYISILLIQLANGVTVTEAIKAYKAHVETGAREVEIQTRKNKKKITIPDNVEICREIAEKPVENLREILQIYAKRVLGVNTKTLKYAYYRKLLSQTKRS